MPEQDSVDVILSQWARERPDLDRRPMAVVGRVSRLASLLGARLAEVFETFGLTGADFDVLATLRRSGEPYRLNPTDLCQSMMVSSGGMTKRLDRLEGQGLLRRDPDPDDRRATLVTLTARGRTLVDEVVVAHVQNEASLLEPLTHADRAELVKLLRKLLVSLERD